MAGNVSDTDSAMMRRTFSIPFIDEPARADGETVTAIGVADFEDGAGHGFAFGHQQLQTSISRFNNRQQRHGTVLYRHLDGEPAAHFAVKHTQRPHFNLSLGDREMPRTIVTHQDYVVAEIGR